MSRHIRTILRIPLFLRAWPAAACRAGCVLLCAAAAWAQLRQCERCGVEALEGEAECRECAAPLPPVRDAADAEPAENADAAETTGGAVGDLLRVMADDVRTARAGERLQPALAFHYYRHAIGLARVIPAAELSDEAREGLVAGLARCRQTLSRVERACALCNGTGKRAVITKAPATGSRGLESTTAAPVPKDCDRCRGLGRATGPRTMEETRVLLGQGRKAFEQQMHALGRVGCGRGFLPAGLEDRLTLQERALIRGGLANGCAACAGLGKTDCATCKGMGTNPCKGRGCASGLVAGAGDAPPAPCAVCRGAAAVACAPCQSNGTVACRTCKGSGQAERCKNCGGEGVATCAACRGKGGDCKTCGGAARALCAQCFGEGVKGR